ncbi:hypothetical protein [Nonomuraea sp. NPDC050405]|uniref:hypothetical protein n=1 Tax=Nonomuraea sp. NPDC050405 TaxID=3154509 RepID=UPI0033ED4717
MVECEHKVPCVGYAFSQRSKAQRPEFEELRQSLTREGRGGEFGREHREHMGGSRPDNVLVRAYPDGHLPEQNQHRGP